MLGHGGIGQLGLFERLGERRLRGKSRPGVGGVDFTRFLDARIGGSSSGGRTVVFVGGCHGCKRDTEIRVGGCGAQYVENSTREFFGKFWNCLARR